MAFNKAKAESAAKRAMEKGQHKKALSLYKKICDADPADLKARLRLGDLHHRVGEVAECLKVYADVAREYARGEQPLRAVAVYRHMLRLDDGLHSVHVSLARVYDQMGLVNDAVSQYQEALAVLAHRGRQLDRLRVIRELLELDPENIRARVRLAEDFLAEGEVDEGVKELRAAALLLDDDGRSDEFLHVADRLLYYRPEDAVISRRVAALHVEREAPQHALVRLQACFRSNPHDTEVLAMLASCFQQLGQGHKALTVLRELARIHDRNGLIAERNETLERVLEIDPADQLARRVLQGRVASASVEEELGFEELAFDDDEDVSELSELSELSNEFENVGPEDSSIDIGGFGRKEPSASQVEFGDLDALADMVAAEPLIPSSFDRLDAESKPSADMPELVDDSFESVEAPAERPEPPVSPASPPPPPVPSVGAVSGRRVPGKSVEVINPSSVDSLDGDDDDGFEEFGFEDALGSVSPAAKPPRSAAPANAETPPVAAEAVANELPEAEEPMGFDDGVIEISLGSLEEVRPPTVASLEDLVPIVMPEEDAPPLPESSSPPLPESSSPPPDEQGLPDSPDADATDGVLEAPEPLDDLTGADSPPAVNSPESSDRLSVQDTPVAGSDRGREADDELLPDELALDDLDPEPNVAQPVEQPAGDEPVLEVLDALDPEEPSSAGLDLGASVVAASEDAASPLMELDDLDLEELTPDDSVSEPAGSTPEAPVDEFEVDVTSVDSLSWATDAPSPVDSLDELEMSFELSLEELSDDLDSDTDPGLASAMFVDEDYGAIELDEPVAAVVDVQIGGAAKNAEEAPPIPAALKTELSELDFYAENGMESEALELIDELIEQFGAHPELLSRKARLEA